MGKSYEPAPDEVRERAIALIKRFHPDLELVKLRLDLLMASTDMEDGHAVTHGGHPAYAVVKIVGPKERAKGQGDAEIVIDRDAYLAMDGAKRDALLDHELYHLEIVRGKNTRPKVDDYGRPKLKIRKHDFQVGWFHEIARRHGRASIEVQQASAFVGEQGQLYFGFSEAFKEILNGLLPTEDSAAREATIPADVGERLVDAAAAGRGVEGFVELAKRHGASMTMSSGGKSVTIDSDGVHAEPSQLQLAEATTIALADGSLTRSALQRRLRIGYNHACAIVEKLVALKVVQAESEGGKFLAVTAGPFGPPGDAPVVQTADGRAITTSEMASEIRDKFEGAAPASAAAAA